MGRFVDVCQFRENTHAKRIIKTKLHDQLKCSIETPSSTLQCIITSSLSSTPPLPPPTIPNSPRRLPRYLISPQPPTTTLPLLPAPTLMKHAPLPLNLQPLTSRQHSHRFTTGKRRVGIGLVRISYLGECHRVVKAFKCARVHSIIGWHIRYQCHPRLKIGQ